ncbi:MAG: hypothetical protein ACTSQJ_13150 [Promethearchaeota archaeon]
MLLYENKKAKVLYFLKLGVNPFKKFVSTGEIKEESELVPSRNEFLNEISQIIKKNENFILPIIGGVGLGKTHLYWVLKEKLHYHNTIYISLENIFKKFYYNIYSTFIEELGVEPLRSITNKLCNEWGALERKFGFFHISDIEKVRKKAQESWNSKFKDKIALMDAINAITAHQLDPYKKIESENWLLGELMDYKELSHLNLMHDLSNKKNAFTMLKILIENSKLGTIIFIDDFEKLISIMKTEDKEEVIFDPTWLYDIDAETPEKIAAQNLLDKILKLQEIRGLRIIITLKSINALNDIKKFIQEKNKKLLLLFKDPLFLSNFKEDDIFYLYKNKMELFYKDINYFDFIKEYPESYFPINEKILKNIFALSKGNPREIIKYFIKIFNEIIYSGDKLENIIKYYENISIN